jgi:hypothetical protein
MEAQMHAQLQESGRLLGDSEAEVRRLRKTLDEALASKEALREKAAMEFAAKQRAAEEAEERHLVQERRLLCEVDRERMATRQANTELDKEQKARLAEADAARNVRDATQQALQDEKAAHRHAADTWSRQQQEAQVELATLRERAAGAEQRATDLASQLQRKQEQSERDISRLRDSHAATSAALRHLKGHAKGNETPPPSRARKSSK